VVRVVERGEFPVDVGWAKSPSYTQGLGERTLSRALVVEEPSRLGQALVCKPGLRAALWVSPEGTKVLERGEGLTEENVLALVEVSVTGERACLDMDIGRLERATITGPAGTVVVVGFANGALITLFSEAYRSQDVDLRVTEALRDAGVLAAETTRA